MAGQAALILALAIVPARAGWTLVPSTPGAVLGALLVIAGVALAGWAMARLGPNLTPFPKPRPDAALVDHGPYTLARHPIYGGLILAGVGWALWRAGPIHLPLAFLLAVFMNAKASREERWLVIHYPEYQEYRERTRRRLIPWVI